MEKHIVSELSSPWKAPSLQVPLPEFLPGMGRIRAGIVSVVLIPAPTKDCHISPGSIGAREREGENQRDKKRIRD